MAELRSQGPEPGSSAWSAGVDAAAGALTDAAVGLQVTLEERAERARRLVERTQELTVTASDDGGTVRAGVDSEGVLVGLELSEQVRRWPAERIAEAVLQVTRRAQSSIAAGMRPVLAETIGADNATARAVLARYETRFPPPDEPSPGTEPAARPR